MVDFFLENYQLIFQKSLEHLFIAGTSLGLGILVAVPLGIFISQYDRFANVVIGISSVLQTVPSLALLAILTIIGVGKPPAIIALFIYSLLPILRNTYLGMTGVNENVLDSARGMGFTKSQILFKVQLPLAIPVIMSGIRLSAVYVLAWTSIASYIGAGGLGDFIFVGLNNYVLSMILWGTIPVTLMALVVDFLLGKLQDFLTPRGIEGEPA